MAKQAIDAADGLGKMAQKVGVSVESLSALEYAGKLSDVSLEQLGTGLKKLSVNLNEVATNADGDAAAAFKAIGVSVRMRPATCATPTRFLPTWPKPLPA